jgi:eukaryotic-like serine/threonine-protein kinase
MGVVSESTRFGPYVVYECLGAGGMAAVHRATIELEDDDVREVALKRLLPQFADDKRFVEDLVREGKLAAQLDHPNIVRILELGRIGRTYFIAMDLIRGRSLATLMQRSIMKQAFPPLHVAIALVREALDALDHAHAAQIVHRDLTPSNLIVTDTGNLKIIDFGVAKALVGSLQTSSGLAKGKLGYMPIEAISGKHVDTRADIFSLGVVLWELIALRRLFHGDTDIEVINAVRAGKFEPPSVYHRECPLELDSVVLRALERSREDRWSSAGEMAEALDEVRLFYPCTEADIIAWHEDLYSDTDTEMQPYASPFAAEEPSDEYELTYGVDSGTYDQVEIQLDPGPTSRAYEDFGDGSDQHTQLDPKFIDSDTVISTFDRKR